MPNGFLFKFLVTINDGGFILKNNIESIRKELKMNQALLAEKLDVSRQTISSLENGRYNPSLILAFKIANLFEKKIEEVFVYEGDDYEEQKNS